MENRSIVDVSACEDEPDVIIIRLNNGHIIMLSFRTLQRHPQFADAQTLELPQTDGASVFWPNGAHLTLEEIMTLLRTDRAFWPKAGQC